MSNQRFISTVEGTLDGKGRVCIPASWRKILDAQDTGGVYICPNLEGGSLDGFGQALMDAECERLDAMDPLLSALHDDLATHITAESMLLPVDVTGRIRLPDEFIKAAGLTEKVVFVGLGRKFQIWDAEAYAPVKAKRLAGALAARAAQAAKEDAARDGAAQMPTASAGTP